MKNTDIIEWIYTMANGGILFVGVATGIWITTKIPQIDLHIIFWVSLIVGSLLWFVFTYMLMSKLWKKGGGK